MLLTRALNVVQSVRTISSSVLMDSVLISVESVTADTTAVTGPTKKTAVSFHERILSCLIMWAIFYLKPEPAEFIFFIYSNKYWASKNTYTFRLLHAVRFSIKC